MPRKRGLSLQAVRLLAAMLDDPAREYYGLELTGRTELASGTIYPLLQGLEGKGMLSSRWEQADPSIEKRPRRRLYRLTGEGEAAVRTELARLQPAPVSSRAKPGLA